MASNNLSTEDQLQDLLIRYEALEQEVKLLKLENNEYQKHVYELAEKNAALIEELDAFQGLQELTEIGKHHLSLTTQLSSTLDDFHVDNMDLNAQLTEYEQKIQKFKLENISLKNENTKYRIALENHELIKVKTMEINQKNRLKLENKIKQLQQENDALIYETSKLYSSKNTPSNFTYQPLRQDSFEDKKKSSIFRIRYSLTGTRKSQPEYINFSSVQTEHPRSTKSSLSGTQYVQIFETDDDESSDDEDDDEDDMVDCGYGSYSFSKDTNLKHSASNEYDTDILLAKIEEIEKLQEINNENQSVIVELKGEVKKLRQQNHKLLQQLEGGFKCVGFTWFQ